MVRFWPSRSSPLPRLNASFDEKISEPLCRYCCATVRLFAPHHDAVPFRALLPFAVAVLVGLIGRQREALHTCLAPRGIARFGVAPQPTHQNSPIHRHALSSNAARRGDHAPETMPESSDISMPPNASPRSRSEKISGRIAQRSGARARSLKATRANQTFRRQWLGRTKYRTSKIGPLRLYRGRSF